jgi:DNA ligase D-like protein (predicted ligase)
MARSPQKRADTNAELPAWISPQLCQLVKEAPSGQDWAHELKFDGYRIHARIDRTDVRLLTRTGLDWTEKYPTIAAALRTLSVRQAYLDGELCGVRPDGVTCFALIQNAADRRGGSDLVYFIFDLLYIDGQDLMPLPLSSRKARLAVLLERRADAIRYSDHQIGRGQAFHRHVCKLGLEGIVSKRLDAGYSPGQRGFWLKIKCLNREEFVVVGWTDPEGSRPYIGALLQPATSAARIAVRRRIEGISRPAVDWLNQSYRETRVDPSIQWIGPPQARGFGRRNSPASLSGYMLPPPPPPLPPPLSCMFPLFSGE